MERSSVVKPLEKETYSLSGMKRLLRSKWFWAVIVGKYLVSALVLAYITSPTGHLFR